MKHNILKMKTNLLFFILTICFFMSLFKISGSFAMNNVVNICMKSGVKDKDNFINSNKDGMNSISGAVRTDYRVSGVSRIDVFAEIANNNFESNSSKSLNIRFLKGLFGNDDEYKKYVNFLFKKRNKIKSLPFNPFNGYCQSYYGSFGQEGCENYEESSKNFLENEKFEIDKIENNIEEDNYKKKICVVDSISSFNSDISVKGSLYNIEIFDDNSFAIKKMGKKEPLFFKNTTGILLGIGVSLVFARDKENKPSEFFDIDYIIVSYMCKSQKMGSNKINKINKNKDLTNKSKVQKSNNNFDGKDSLRVRIYAKNKDGKGLENSINEILDSGVNFYDGLNNAKSSSYEKIFDIETEKNFLEHKLLTTEGKTYVVLIYENLADLYDLKSKNKILSIDLYSDKDFIKDNGYLGANFYEKRIKDNDYSSINFSEERIKVCDLINGGNNYIFFIVNNRLFLIDKVSQKKVFECNVKNFFIYAGLYKNYLMAISSDRKDANYDDVYIAYLDKNFEKEKKLFLTKTDNSEKRRYFIKKKRSDYCGFLETVLTNKMGAEIVEDYYSKVDNDNFKDGKKPAIFYKHSTERDVFELYGIFSFGIKKIFCERFEKKFGKFAIFDESCNKNKNLKLVFKNENESGVLEREININNFFEKESEKFKENGKYCKQENKSSKKEIFNSKTKSKMLKGIKKIIEINDDYDSGSDSDD